MSRKKNRKPSVHKFAIERCESRNLLAADLSIDITDGGASVEEGNGVVYAVSFENQGNESTTDAKIFVDLPSGVTLNAEISSEGWNCEEQRCALDVGELTTGTSREAKLGVTVSDAIPDDIHQLSVWANIRSTAREFRLRNNWDSSTTPIDREYHDLRFNITDNGARVAAGETVEYSIAYDNRGQHAATDAKITVTLPEFTSYQRQRRRDGWVCEGQVCSLSVGEVAARAEGAATIVVAVSAELPVQTKRLVVRGEIQASGADSRPNNNRDNSTTPIRNIQHDLRMNITDRGARVTAGGAVSYAVEYKNMGESAATGAVVTVTLPDHTSLVNGGSTEGWSCEGQVCTLIVGDISAGESGGATLVLQAADAIPTDVRQLGVWAEIKAASGVDKNMRNNRDSSTTPIDRAYHDLRIDFTDRGAAVAAGGSVVYFATYENRGQHPPTGASISVDIPEHMAFNADSSSAGWTCVEGVCSLSVGDVAAGASGELTLGVTVAEELPSELTSFEIWATIKADSGADSRTGNNSDRSVTPVREQPAAEA